MQFYDIKVRFGQNDGTIFSEVAKTRVSAPEVLLLKALHGDSNVVVKELVADENADQQAIRLYMSERYVRDRPESAAAKAVRDLFGASFRDLPEELPGWKDKSAKKSAKAKSEAEGAGAELR